MLESENTWYKYDVVISGTLGYAYIGAESNSLATYGTEVSTTAFSITNNGNYFALIGDGGGGVTYLNGIIIRAYPPNGVMPTVTFDFPTATGTNFQQMINITESSFSSYLTYNSNFANFEYFYANGTIIPAWIESNNSGKLVTWAKLSKSIPALSNATIYLGFAGSNNLLSSSGTSGIGEAPQLSCGSTSTSSCSTYAEYDDGAKVFNNYWNFAGTNLPSNLIEFGSTAGTLTVANSLTIKPTGTTAQYVGIYAPLTFVYSGITLETLVKPIQLGGGGSFNDYATFIGNGQTNSETTFVNGYSNNFWAYGNAASALFYWFSGSQNAGCCAELDSATANVIYETSFTWTSSAEYASDTNGYLNSWNNPTLIFNSADASQLAVGATVANSGTPIYILYWLRTRAYPPNGAMPSVTFGSVS